MGRRQCNTRLVKACTRHFSEIVRSATMLASLERLQIRSWTHLLASAVWLVSGSCIQLETPRSQQASEVLRNPIGFNNLRWMLDRQCW